MTLASTNLKCCTPTSKCSHYLGIGFVELPYLSSQQQFEIGLHDSSRKHSETFEHDLATPKVPIVELAVFSSTLCLKEAYYTLPTKTQGVGRGPHFRGSNLADELTRHSGYWGCLSFGFTLCVCVCACVYVCVSGAFSGPQVRRGCAKYNQLRRLHVLAE